MDLDTSSVGLKFTALSMTTDNIVRVIMISKAITTSEFRHFVFWTVINPLSPKQMLLFELVGLQRAIVLFWTLLSFMPFFKSAQQFGRTFFEFKKAWTLDPSLYVKGVSS
jgi:hypothetical protein